MKANSRSSVWSHGPTMADDSVTFRLWAPLHDEVRLEFEDGRRIPMVPKSEGFFVIQAEAAAGSLYRFRLPTGALVPDPASRFQPRDVHGPSELIDHDSYTWRDAEWRGRPWVEIVLYELHLGTFTPGGGFASAIAKLDHLASLGVTALQIMPVNDFSGRWGWGYDGVFLYAPDAAYGRPNDFKALVDAAHARGMAVLLDVVYNHFGPVGNYLSAYAPGFFTSHHSTPWGEAISFDEPDSRPVRDFFIENAEYWLETFHLDGLRLDAVDLIKDDSQPHILDELATRIRSRFPREVHLVLENGDNEAHRLGQFAQALGSPKHYTAQWNDDIHHVLHVAGTGEQGGYYAEFGATDLLARSLSEGFAFQGEVMRYRGKPRGSYSAHLPPTAFVSFIQNHDQVGNRAFGDRISALCSPEIVKALASVYLLCPQIPLIFMGEEWGAKQPFPFFCDFEGELAEAVRKGRAQEFAKFPDFAHHALAASLPDPIGQKTFLAAKLDWSNVDDDHLAFYAGLLRARREFVQPLLPSIVSGGEARVLGEQAVQVVWNAGPARLVLNANLSQSQIALSPVDKPFWQFGETEDGLGPWSVIWTIGPL
jgi:maltooligosyltrehalose trehalohydrolase